MRTVRFAVISLLLAGCSTGHKDEYFGVKSKCMPPLHTEEGDLIDVRSDVWVGQYMNMEGGGTQEFKGMPKGSIGSLWKITYIKGGPPDYKKLCGKRPVWKDWTREQLLAEGAKERNKKEWEEYWKIEEKRRACVEKVQADAEKRKKSRYFYARSTPDHKIVYQPKKKGHEYWEATIYNGRVSDLTVDALSEEQKRNIKSLDSHPCYRFGNKRRGDTCYDLPGKESSIYYVIRSIPVYRYGLTEDELIEQLSYRDILIAPPVEWTEIEGIEIDKAMYDYLKERCRIGEEFCTLDYYEGPMSKKQREYVKRVGSKK